MWSLKLMLQPLVKYFDFNGRARRSEYWLFFLFQILLSIIIGTISALSPIIGDSLDTITNLALLIPVIAVNVRRFHDIGQTGWWVLFPMAICLLALIVYVSVTGAQGFAGFSAINPSELENADYDTIMRTLTPLIPALAWIGIPTFIASLVTFIMNLKDGEPKTNQFGPDPKGRDTSSKTTGYFA